MSYIKILVAICITLFAAFNYGSKAEIVLIPKIKHYETPILLLMLGTLLASGIVVALSFIPKLIRLNKELKNTRKDLIHAEEEINRLRALPILQDSNSSNMDSMDN